MGKSCAACPIKVAPHIACYIIVMICDDGPSHTSCTRHLDDIACLVYIANALVCPINRVPFNKQASITI